MKNDPFRERYNAVFGEAQSELLDKVYDYATRMHDGQKRDSGEPYITHPIAVANLLLDIGLDLHT
ncbi:MAG: hypothetical protein K2L51_06370, partial [Clostridiales bacterium]|nr:hypothetical protein [Clostridiales bacterium]